MESPLEVLSRAATMVQDNANETRLTTKELPTSKWRRDRRLRATEYQHSISTSSSSSSPTSSSTPPSSPHSLPCNVVKPLNETTNTTSSSTSVATAAAVSECPIDMSVTSTTIKPRTPPPPYREPLPGSTFASLARPSVITQAPPKRDSFHNHHHHNNLISNRENDNRSTESISMCDPVIDEHFRRSLGADYMALFAKKSSTSPPQQQQQQQQQQQPKPAVSPVSPRSTTITVTNNESIGSSVDDHFAKALGDTWKKLQADKESKNEAISTTPPTPSSITPSGIEGK